MGYQIINSGAEDGRLTAPTVVKQGPIQDEGSPKKISTRQIVNLLNYINFQDDFLVINLKHSRFGNVVSIQAKPHPCTGNELVCEWARPEEVRSKLIQYEFDSISLNHENNLLVIKPELAAVNESSIKLLLSEQYYPLKIEAIEHYPCIAIKAEVLQNSAIFKGVLMDFSANSFHVQISLEDGAFCDYVRGFAGDVDQVVQSPVGCGETRGARNTLFEGVNGTSR